MKQPTDEKQTSKISPVFMARLQRLKPQQKIRALVMLRTEVDNSTPVRRSSREERQARMAAVQKAATAAVAELGHILAQYDGRCLTTHVNALGTIPVETTAAGLRALAASEHVKAILEDQPISPAIPSIPLS